METEKDPKVVLNELIEGADPERIDAVTRLLEMSDERAMTYGDALSLLVDADYDLVLLKMAIAKVKEDEGLKVVRTRTKVRRFEYLKDEDDPEGGLTYRAFYVSTITPEQKIAIGVGKADKLKDLMAGGMTDEGVANNPEKMVEFLNSDMFTAMMTEPNKIVRQVVIQNMVEVEVLSDGSIRKPFEDFVDGKPVEEFVLQQLEEDLNLLLEQQEILTKNSLTIGI